MSEEPTAKFGNNMNRVMIQTEFMKPSGEFGTPMFSRVGKQTVTEIQEFQGPPMVQCESSFAQVRNEERANKAAEDQELDQLDDNTIKDFMPGANKQRV